MQEFMGVVESFDEWAFKQIVLMGDSIIAFKNAVGINEYFYNNRTGERFYINQLDSNGG